MNDLEIFPSLFVTKSNRIKMIRNSTEISSALIDQIIILLGESYIVIVGSKYFTKIWQKKDVWSIW